MTRKTQQLFSFNNLHQAGACSTAVAGSRSKKPTILPVDDTNNFSQMIKKHQSSVYSGSKSHLGHHNDSGNQVYQRKLTKSMTDSMDATQINDDEEDSKIEGGGESMIAKSFQTYSKRQPSEAAMSSEVFSGPQGDH